MTLLNCICAAVPARERVITCEDVQAGYTRTSGCTGARAVAVASESSRPDLQVRATEDLAEAGRGRRSGSPQARADNPDFASALWSPHRRKLVRQNAHWRSLAR